MAREIRHSAAIWGLVRRQHGVVARGQLLAMGVSEEGVDWRIERGRLHPLHAGVYAVGRRELARQGELMAAVLACGDGAALSHRSAGELWGLLAVRGGRIDVSVPSGNGRRRPGISIHRRPSPPLQPPAPHPSGIPVLAPIPTLVDLAGVLPRAQLERAVNDADTAGLATPDEVRRALVDFRGRRGVAVLRTLLDRDTFRLSDSELESTFRRLVARAQLPMPATKAVVDGFEVDFSWPELGLVVETDGLRYHRTPAQQSRALRRDQAHAAAGLTTLRFSHAQVTREPQRVVATLRATALRLRARPPTAAVAGRR